MDAFRHFALFTVVRDAAFVALAAATLMVAFSFELAAALAIGASVEFCFALILLLRFVRLSDDGIVRTEAWRILRPAERPAGEAGKHCARNDLQTVLLTFAKAAAGVAALLYGSALFYSCSVSSQSLHAVVNRSLD